MDLSARGRGSVRSVRPKKKKPSFLRVLLGFVSVGFLPRYFHRRPVWSWVTEDRSFCMLCMDVFLCI